MKILEYEPFTEVSAKIEKLWKWNENIEDDKILHNFIKQNRYILSINVVSSKVKIFYSTDNIQEFISFVEDKRQDVNNIMHTYDLCLYRSEKYSKYFLPVYTRDVDDLDTDNENLIKPNSYIPNWRMK